VTKQFVFWAAAEGALHDLCGAVLFGSFTALCFVFARRFSGNRQKKMGGLHRRIGHARAAVVLLHAASSSL